MKKIGIMVFISTFVLLFIFLLSDNAYAMYSKDGWVVPKGIKYKNEDYIFGSSSVVSIGIMGYKR